VQVPAVLLDLSPAQRVLLLELPDLSPVLLDQPWVEQLRQLAQALFPEPLQEQPLVPLLARQPEPPQAQVGNTAISGGLTGVQQGVGAVQNSINEGAMKKQDAAIAGQNAADATMRGDVMSQNYAPAEGMGGGKGMGMAEGGPIDVDSGSFVIPSDIVSALGNGDTGAGMEFLSKYFQDSGSDAVDAGDEDSDTDDEIDHTA